MFLTFDELIDALKTLATVKPADKFEYLDLEKTSICISQFILTQSYGNTCPGDIWHYLDDYDIRYKDKAYDEYQTPLFLSAIEEWISIES